MVYQCATCGTWKDGAATRPADAPRDQYGRIESGYDGPRFCNDYCRDAYEGRVEQPGDPLTPCGWCRRCAIHDDPGGCLTVEAYIRDNGEKLRVDGVTTYAILDDEVLPDPTYGQYDRGWFATTLEYKYVFVSTDGTVYAADDPDGDKGRLTRACGVAPRLKRIDKAAAAREAAMLAEWEEQS